MVSKTFHAAVITLFMGLAGSAAAAPNTVTTLTFEGFSFFQARVPNGHGGLTWNNFWYQDDRGINGASAYPVGSVSGTKVLYNQGGNDAKFFSSTPFKLYEFYATAAWRNGLEVTVRGLLKNAEIFTSSFTLDTKSAVLKVFNWNNIDEVRIEAKGGTKQSGFNGNGTQVAIDNLKIGPAVATVAVPGPEAAAGLPVLAGLAGLLAWRRRYGRS